MDFEKLEQAYTQYSGMAQQAFQMLDGLISKMQTAADNGDTKAGHWAEELQNIVQTLEGGQTHIGTLLQQFHGVMSTFGGASATPGEGGENTAEASKQNSGSSDFISSFLNSDIGKSIEQGAMQKMGENFLGKFFKS